MVGRVIRHGRIRDCLSYFAQLGLLYHKLFQAVYAVTIASLFIGIGIWMGVRKNTVLCPRCGWNVFFKKPMPMVATVIPSVCPNCGLDLENRYEPKDRTNEHHHGRCMVIPPEIR